MYKYSQPLFWGPFVTKTMAKPKDKPNGGHLVMKTKKNGQTKGRTLCNESVDQTEGGLFVMKTTLKPKA